MKNSSIGQLLLIGVPGPEIDPVQAEIIRRVQPGGFILFGRNIKTPTQLRKLIDTLRELSSIEPMITIDQEGGRVSRLKLLGNEPPNVRQLRESGNKELIRRHGEITGQLLKLFGFNLDLCPVLDIAFDEEADNSLRGRCYGTTADQVIELATIFNDALRATGVMSCGKHFPGYSMASGDPHYDLSALPRPLAELEQHELKVFRHFAGNRLFSKLTTDDAGQGILGAQKPQGIYIPEVSSTGVTKPCSSGVEFRKGYVDSMMIGHIAFAELDSSGLPASLSPTVITKLLREEMGFNGLVMSDDFDMGAILNNYSFEDTLRLGLAAGNDMLMICHRTELAERAASYLETLPPDQIDRALRYIAEFKARMVPPDSFSETKFHELDQKVWELRVDTLGEEAAAERSPEDGKRSPVEVY